MIVVFKPVGLTPKQTLDGLREKSSRLKDKKLSYAGRLDPMARGVMLVLVGQECRNREKYLRLPKTYEFEVVLGIETDTHDMLGVLKSLRVKKIKVNQESKLIELINSMKGKRKQKYPSYSYVKVKGKPLWWWARQGRIDEIEVPSKRIEIFKSRLKSFKKIEISQMIEKIKKNIEKVNGDFRQKEIEKRWEEFGQKNTGHRLPVVRVEVECSSGTYVRGLVHEWGQELGCGAIASDIFRTKVGEFCLESLESLGIDKFC